MYYNRLIESVIEKKIKSSGAVLVKGHKFCGKTTTSKLFCKSIIQLIDNDIIEIVSADLKIALNGDKPRLIDEWQNVPELWNYVRNQVDLDNAFGEYVLNGSTTPVESRTTLSLKK